MANQQEVNEEEEATAQYNPWLPATTTTHEEHVVYVECGGLAAI